MKDAERSLVKLRSLKSAWKYNDIATPTRPQLPSYRNISLPVCGKTISSSASKPGSSKAMQLPCDDTYCDLPDNVPDIPIDPDEQACDDPNLASDPRCSTEADTDSREPEIYINELMPIRSSQPGNREFIELKMHPIPSPGQPKGILLHKLVAFTAFRYKLKLVVNVHQKEVNEHGLIAITSSDSIQIPTAEHCQLLPSGNDEPVVLLLLRRPKLYDQKTWAKIKLSSTKDGLAEVNILDAKLKKKGPMDFMKVFEETVVDGYIYGKTTNSPIKDDIKKLIKVGKDCNFIIPFDGIDEPALGPAVSLNVCPTGNKPWHFHKNHIKLGVATPNFPNDCRASIPYQISKIESPRTERNVIGVTINPVAVSDCIAEVSKKRPDSNDLFRLINYNYEFIRKNLDPDYTSEFYPTEDFKTKTLPDLVSKGFGGGRDDFPNITPFEIVPEDERKASFVTQENTWRCKVCHRRLKRCPDSFHHKGREMPLVQTEGVQLPTSSRASQSLLADHLSTKTHYHSVLYTIREDRRNLAVKNRTRDLHDPVVARLTSISNLILISFTFVKTNTATVATDTWYKTLRRIEANVGTGTQMHSRKATGSLIKFISETIFNRIFNYLRDNNDPFSLILDGASDIVHNHYVCIFIQSNEGEDSIPYFAGILRGTKSSTSEAHVKLLKDWANEISKTVTGFDKFFVDNLVGIATDSAATMVKMQSLIQTWIDKESSRPRKLIRILCLAHKLNLATRSALIPLKRDKDYGPNECLLYFKFVEKTMQGTYVWVTLASRRLGEFREIQIANKEPTIELKELHVERWISSEYRTCKNFIGAWKTVLQLLRTIIDDGGEDYTAKVRTDAEEFLTTLTDKTLLITIVFLQDYTAVFKIWSEELQHFVGLYSDQYEKYQKLQDELNNLDRFEGVAICEFLMECQCSQTETDEGEVCDTIERYEESKIITWRGHKFTRTNPEAPRFMELTEALLKKTRERLDFYMDHDLLSNIDVVNPRLFPAGAEIFRNGWQKLSATEDVPIYGKEKIEKMAIKLGMDPETLTREWAYLFLSILESPSYDKYRYGQTTEPFWSAVLRDKKLNWTDTTRYFIRVVKTITIGSTQVESGFSVFNNIKVRRRSLIGDDLLQASMNIIINGPADVDLFDSYDYAVDYNSRGRDLPDDKPCSVEEEDDDEIMNDPTGVGVTDAENVDDEQQPFNLEEMSKEMEDAYTRYLKTREKGKEVTRVRTLQM